MPSDTPTFVLLGAAGYIARSHVKAIKEVGGRLLVAADPHENVGYLEQYFPAARYVAYDSENQISESDLWSADYVVIATPNYLHVSQAEYIHQHLPFMSSEIIIEKPIALGAKQLERLELLRPRKIWGISQLRYHPNASKLLRMAALTNSPIIDITYNSPRGAWYSSTWKARREMSGGLVFNIGIHILDLLCWAFDIDPGRVEVEGRPLAFDPRHTIECALHYFERPINIHISIHPRAPLQREITIHDSGDSKTFNFSEGFNNLHIPNYQAILKGRGPTVESCAPAIQLAEKISNVVY